jgi:CheY-like chemotaxis protein
MEETRRALEQMRATAEDSRAAAADASEQARLRADRLGEALFEAAQKADQAADARIEDARRIVGETSGLLEQAGERMVQRLESLIDRLNAALSEIDTAVADVDERAARLPEQARARVDAVRASVEEGLNALAAASRKRARLWHRATASSRAVPSSALTPVLVLTGRADDDSQVEALESGADDFLSKGVQVPVLLARAANLVARRRAELQASRLTAELERYVSQPARSRLLGNRKPERLHATILFSDLRGFTATSLAEDLDTLFEAMNTVRARQAELVRHWGG